MERTTGKIIAIVPISGGYYPEIKAPNGAVLIGLSENYSEIKTVRGKVAAVGESVHFSTDDAPVEDGTLCAWSLL